MTDNDFLFDPTDPGSRLENARGHLLLQAATELFVSKPSHGRDEIRIYEELALQLLPTAPLSHKAHAARVLARHPNAPAAVLRALLFAEAEVAAILLGSRADFSEVDLLALVATGSPAHLAALAGRHRLPACVVDALAMRLDAAGLVLLARNESVRLPAESIRRLVAAAKGHPDLAAALGARIDIEDVDLIDLFLDLDDKGRRRVHRALEVLALRDFANRRSAPRHKVIDRDTARDIGRAAATRDDGGLAMLLGDVMQLDGGFVLDLLTDKGGEPLTIALKAAGFDEAAATRIILFSGARHHRSYFEVRALLDLFEQVTARAAAQLLAHWHAAGLKVTSSPERSGHLHRPVAEAGTPVRAPADRRTEERRETPGQPQIRRIGN